MTGSGTQYAVVFFLLVYLARVLEPRDFGLMATVSVGLDLGTRIARWGQVELLQQKRWRSDDARNQSIRLSLSIALLFCLLFIAIAVPLGRHYQSDALTQMIYVCAPVFLFSASGSTAEAVLRSEFKFKVLAFRSTVATLIGAAVAIILVNFGYGPLALAIQRLAQAVCAGIWVWTAIDWRPCFGRKLRWSRKLVTEGASVMAGTLLPVAVPRSIDLLVGFFMGPAMLGIMRVAFRINEFVGQMVVMPLVSVANAELSGKSDDHAAMRRAYLRLTQASAVLMCPVLIGLSLIAPEAIPFIFSEKWSGCVPFVQVIGLLALVAPINYYFAPAMVALGQSRLVLRQGLIQIVLGVTLTALGAQISLIAVAIAHVVRGLAVSLYNLADLRRHMDLSPLAMARSMAPPYLATLGMTGAIVAARMLGAEALPPTSRMFLLILVGGTSYAALLWLLAQVGLWPDYQALAAKCIPARWRRASMPG